MSTQTIHHAYNDVVAAHYDLDPQGVIGASLDRALGQLRRHLPGDGAGRVRVLDVGMGTGKFLAGLQALGPERIEPFGLDLAENMVESARARVAGLVAEVGDAARLADHFPGQTFACITTHFITGFVPLAVLAPQIAARLEPGGWWSLVGGTLGGYPALRARADTPLLRWLVGAGRRRIERAFINPADVAEVVRTMEAHGFEVCAAETFEPALDFPDFAAFLEFAYRGGWLTPAVEAVGLHKAGPVLRWLIDRLAFPVRDCHRIAIVLARKRPA
jgi:SAM-dependent methyltransferase